MMTEILQTNIFFFITSVAVVLVTILVAWALYYVVGILRNVRDISQRIDTETIHLQHDIKKLRSTVKTEGMKVGVVSQFIVKTIIIPIMTFIGRRTRSRK